MTGNKKGPAGNMSYSCELRLSTSPVVPLFLDGFMVALDGRHGQRATLRKTTHSVHIAASLRHRELYGKKAYHVPSGAAAGSVRS